MTPEQNLELQHCVVSLYGACREAALQELLKEQHKYEAVCSEEPVAIAIRYNACYGKGAVKTLALEVASRLNIPIENG